MHPAIAALLAIPPKPVPGAELLAELYGEAPATLEDLLEAGPEIYRELVEARELARRSKEAVERCLKLKPVSTPQAPPGF